jgi:hypothetical protein
MFFFCKTFNEKRRKFLCQTNEHFFLWWGKKGRGGNRTPVAGATIQCSTIKLHAALASQRFFIENKAVIANTVFSVWFPVKRNVKAILL